MQKWCRVNEIATMNNTNCHGYKVLPPKSFYPISYLRWRKYFTEYSSLPNWDEDVIGVHVWNNLSAKRKVFKFSDQMYAQLAKLYCPLVFSIAPEIF
jgi:adenylosuccinate synthase